MVVALGLRGRMHRRHLTLLTRPPMRGLAVKLLFLLADKSVRNTVLFGDITTRAAWYMANIFPSSYRMGVLNELANSAIQLDE
jgi:hypothetical protein